MWENVPVEWFMDSAQQNPVEIRLDWMTLAGRISYIKFK